MPTKAWSTACSHRRTTASAGRNAGSTWSATPTPTATNSTPNVRTPGAIATTSSQSFNDDKPYDRFLQEQIAGDELYPGNEDALIATGFHRAGPIHLVAGNQDEEVKREEVLTEMAGGIGSAFLGLTVGCARCHNHKFDPILQADYYRLQAVFAATEGKDVVIATEAEKSRLRNSEEGVRSAPRAGEEADRRNREALSRPAARAEAYRSSTRNC